MEAPNEKQARFFESEHRFTAYGGARGGGKSWAVRRKAALLAFSHPDIKMILLRRSYPELRENHILPLQRELMGAAKYRDSRKCFEFPNGARLLFGYCANESDVLQYQGQEYDIIFLDEATQFTEFQFSTLTACLRGANNLPKRMYLTCNPGGVGHAWVKRLFIDRDYRQGERPEDYLFIPASVYDNRALIERDPGYVRMLKNLPDALRKAWLEGDWGVFAGQYFAMWREQVHVIAPFALPRHYRRVITLDYGLDMLAAYWIALDERGLAYVYREVYESGLIISEAAARIRQEGMDGAECVYAPPDLWNRRQDTGKSAAEIFAECGVPLVKAQNNRVQGWYDMAEWLKIRCADRLDCGSRRVQRADGQSEGELCGGAPGEQYACLRIFEGRCKNLVRCLPQVQADSKNPNDVAVEPHELTHSVDAIRYFCAGRPAPAVIPQNQDGEDAGELAEFLAWGG